MRTGSRLTAVVVCAVLAARAYVDSGGRDPAADGSPAPTQRPVITVAQIRARLGTLLGREVAVRGRALFTFTCPPPSADGPSMPCVATGYLADERRTDLPPEAVDDALALSWHGASVGGPAQTLAGYERDGWRHGQLYVVDAVVKPEVLGGRPTANAVLEIRSRRAS